MPTADEVKALAYKGAEKDLGAVAPEEVRTAQAPVPINPSLLPADQPLCPGCRSGLYPIRQNQAGDTLFECLKCATEAGAYQAVFRSNPPRWDTHAQATPDQVARWRAPLRQKDLDDEAAGKKTIEPVAAPSAAWPEPIASDALPPEEPQKRGKKKRP